MELNIPYPKFVQISKMGDALIHFGKVASNPQLAQNSPYHESQVDECLRYAGEFPVIVCGVKKINRMGYQVITIKWSWGDHHIALYENEARAAMQWADERRAKYYEVNHE